MISILLLATWHAYWRLARLKVVCFLISVPLCGLHAGEGDWQRLIVGGETAPIGIFDPSLIADPKGGFVMAYSTVARSASYPDENERVISTVIARDDGRDGWLRVAEVYRTTDIQSSGRAVSWNSEVPSIAVGTTWRLAAHRFPLIEGDRRFEYGWIGLLEAARPEELAVAREIKLLVGRGYKFDATLEFPNTADPVLLGHDVHKDLSRCVAFTEPAILIKNDVLYLAATCAEMRFLSGVSFKIVLFRCNAPCQAARQTSWDYIGELLGDNAASRDGVKAYTAASFFSLDGRDYVLATPVGDEPFEGAYKGCRAFKVLDLDAARVSDRYAEIVSPKDGTFEGACAASEESVFSSRLELSGQGPRFHIYRANGIRQALKVNLSD